MKKTTFFILLIICFPVLLYAQFTAPVIDGNIDEVWSNANSYSLTKLVKDKFGVDPESEDLSASFRSLWDEDNFYLLLEVTDNVIYHNVLDKDHQNDNIEIYIDLNNSKNTLYDGIDDDQIRFIPDVDTINSKLDLQSNEIEFQYAETENGYLFEVRLPWNVLTTESFSPAIGLEIGFDMMATDNDGSDTKDYILSWNAYENNAWQNPQLFGILKLKDNGITEKVTSPFGPPEHDELAINENNVSFNLYVDKNHASASDQNAGNDPSLPLVSIAKALEIAADSLGEGVATKISISPGIYREYALTINQSGSANLFLNTELVIEGTTKNEVIISGSELWNDNWTNHSANIYKHPWTLSIEPDKPWGEKGPTQEIAQRREMVFVDGYWMEQVLSQEGLKPNSFFVDEENDWLYVQVADTINFSSADKEISLHGDEEDMPWPPRRLFFLPDTKDKVVIRNLVFQHANMRLSEAAVKITNWKTLMENCIIQWNNGLGLSVTSGQQTEINNCDINNNGGSGITTWGTKYLKWDNNSTNYNNWRGNLGNYHSHAIGGIKFHHTTDIELTNHKSIGNKCAGLWTDLEIINILFDACLIEDNWGPGLLIEISKEVEVNNCTIRHNTPGIRCHSSHEVSFDNCHIQGNTIQFAVYKDHRDFSSTDWTSQFDGRIWDKTPNNWSISNSTIICEDNEIWQTEREKRIPGWINYTHPGYQPFWHFSHDDYKNVFFGGADIAYNNNTWTHESEDSPFRDDKGNFLNVSEWEEWISGILSNTEALDVIDQYARQDDASLLSIDQLQNAGAESINSDFLVEYKIIIADEDSISDLLALQDAVDAGNAFAQIRNMAENNNADNLSISMLVDCGVTFRTDRLEYYKPAIAGVEKSDLPDVAALQALLDATTAIMDNHKPNVFCYPNPVKECLFIKNHQQVKSLTIINSTGRKVMEKKVPPTIMDIHHLPGGIYFIIFYTPNGAIQQKIIKN